MKNRLALQEVPQAADSFISPRVSATEFTTVSEAVRAAMQLYGDELVFGNDVERGIAGLHPTAGPPSKVFNYLEGLAKMVQVRRQGLLRVGMVRFLNEHGLRCSGESESVRRDFGRRRLRTFHDGQRRTFFEHHLKISEGTHPDRCVRAYFTWQESGQKAVVGSVGRHPE